MTSSADSSELKSTSVFLYNSSDDEADDDANEDKHAQNMKILIELKFALEKEITIYLENFKENKSKYLRNVSDDLDIYAVFCLYQNNIEMYGGTYLEKQTELLKQIDEILLRKCEHNWIDDVIDGIFSSRDICYCSKCFIRK